MPNRTNTFQKLNVEDIFHGESANGVGLICLVTALTATTIQARTVTTQLCLDFDRQTGTATWGRESTLCIIDSMAPLPVEIHNVLLELDRRYRSNQDPERITLLDVEKHALVFAVSFYRANLL
jgi:hypothetical protein